MNMSKQTSLDESARRNGPRLKRRAAIAFFPDKVFDRAVLHNPPGTYAPSDFDGATVWGMFIILTGDSPRPHGIMGPEGAFLPGTKPLMRSQLSNSDTDPSGGAMYNGGIVG